MLTHWSTRKRRIFLSFIVIALALLSGKPLFNKIPHREVLQPAQEVKLSGEEANQFLQSEGAATLKAALDDQRFRISREKRSPFGGNNEGYLALSHEQNLNAWFDDDGVTIRPTGAELKDQWSFRMKLKAYGYGEKLVHSTGLKNVSVNGARIEYQIGSGVTEWYENRSVGIEQGFTIMQRPVGELFSTEALKLVVSVAGSLSVLPTGPTQELKLVNQDREPVLTYGKLTVIDAALKSLPAHLETTSAGNEIVLVVDDQDAVYPIVVDPITATEKSRLFPTTFEVAARFGFSVAVYSNVAIVGAPMTDQSVSTADTGRVYVFVKNFDTGVWSFERDFIHPTMSSPSFRCGYSVGASAFYLAYGCPGFQGTKGSVVVLVRSLTGSYTMYPIQSPDIHNSDRFGANLDISTNYVLVGSPFYDFNTGQDTNDGAYFLFEIDDTRVLSTRIFTHSNPFPNNLFGTDVAMTPNAEVLVVGEPNADQTVGVINPVHNRGEVHVFTKNAAGNYDQQILTAFDSAADDSFGFTVDISGNTIVVGAPFDDNEKGTNAGAVYVFRKLNSGLWQQEAKIVASDGFANDEFSYLGLSISFGTFVVGSHFADFPTFPFDPNENRGEVYIYTTVNNVWTEQMRLRASDGSPGDEFGIGIDLFLSTLIVGAPNDDVIGQADSGSAYAYELSCLSSDTPSLEVVVGQQSLRKDSIDVCNNSRVSIYAGDGVPFGQTYQWRKNGVNMPGQTNYFISPIVTLADDGSVYDLVSSNSCSSRISAPVVVRVKSGCDVTPSNLSFSSAGGSGAINVTACPTCYWGVTLIPHVGLYSGISPSTFDGQGNGQVSFNLTRNPYAFSLSEDYEINGRRISVAQDASPHFFAIALSGRGSIFDVIEQANQLPGDDLITFDLPGAGPHLIKTAFPLVINSNLRILNDRAGDEPVTYQRDEAVVANLRLLEVAANANVEISGLTFSKGNLAAADGSAISNLGKLTLRNCTFRDSQTAGLGTVRNRSILNVDRCTFSFNVASSGGGGIYNDVNAVLTVSNSTFSGNFSDAGAAIRNGFSGQGIAYATLRNCTFSPGLSTSGIMVNNEGVMSSINSIIRRGTLMSISNSGTFTSLGHNLVDDSGGGDGGTGPGGLLNATGDIRNTNPNLGVLALNGGPTQTHALVSPSAAINAGDDAVLTGPFNLLSDQRGFLRKTGLRVDIGAFENGTTTSPTIQFSAPSYSGSEANGRIDLIVSRTGDTSSPLTVNYTTTDQGSSNSCSAVSNFASKRCDYLSALGTLRLNPGESSKILSVLLIDDVIPENSERLTIELTDPRGAILGQQSSADVVITDNETTNPPSPLSQPLFFVRQHYLDFLNREPDSGGLNFWSNEITSCGSNQQCTEVKRINVSAAFFLSIEFQETGYLVYRAYKAAYGNVAGKPVPVILNDFLLDTQEIGRNVVVGTPGWEAQLESNKQAYVLALVNRPEFIKAFGSALTADQFVTQINTNASGVLSPSEKANLVSILGSTPFDATKRAQVLRAVAEDADLRNAEFNKAFVLMQYFGYMRRNPDDLPDTNYDGFTFWLAKLNQFNGNYINAEMVKAFIQSIEYGRRFAP